MPTISHSPMVRTCTMAVDTDPSCPMPLVSVASIQPSKPSAMAGAHTSMPSTIPRATTSGDTVTVASESSFVMRGFSIDQECDLADGAELFATIDGEAVQVGTLPSVSWSHSAKGWIGLSSLRTEHAGLAEGFVEIDGDKIPCRITDLPVIDLERRRQVPAPL